MLPRRAATGAWCFLDAAGETATPQVPLLKPFKKGYEQAFADFRAYKGKIPVCGLILLDPTLTKVVLVCNWAKTSWGLPKGKLNRFLNPIG